MKFYRGGEGKIVEYDRDLYSAGVIVELHPTPADVAVTNADLLIQISENRERDSPVAL